MKPLHGLRIVSVEQFGAAPYGTMLLADLGAEVIKVENAGVGGDPARYTGPYLLGPADSEYFQVFNMSKKSVALDLRSDEGRAGLHHLIADADAVVNNLRGDLATPMGLDYQALGAIKPSIVCVHVSAYGRDNERASWPGYDYLMQAESGLMHLTGEPDGPPSRLGAPSIIDQCTGLTATVGLLAAIMQARAAPDDVHPARAGERATSRSGASTPPVMPATRDASGRVWILLWVLAGLASIAVGVYFALR